LWEIFKLFLELSDKAKVSEYLEVLLRYLFNSPGDFNQDDIREQVTGILEEGGETMQTIAQQLREEGIKIGEEKGIKIGEEKGMKKKAEETAKKLLGMGIEIEKISEATGLKEEEIKKLKEIPEIH
jgi:predicted transposase/invertase (TIGR01784 family)